MNKRAEDVGSMADQVIGGFGLEPILAIGTRAEALVRALRGRGVRAQAMDGVEPRVSLGREQTEPFLSEGAALSLPIEDASYPTVVCLDYLEHLSPVAVPGALSEIYRVAQHGVFLSIVTAQDPGEPALGTSKGREWWERRCFEAGFRKHPAYYAFNSYESLNRDGGLICIPLEKLPFQAVKDYPLDSLDANRNLRLDSLRDTGERADACLIRYHWAASRVKPGDRVLDASSGLGCGDHLLRFLTQADLVVGIDASPYSVDYAKASFIDHSGRGEYWQGVMPDILSTFPDASFEVVLGFEVLERMADPVSVLREFHRLLIPGGRIIVSVPNDWGDETGKDPDRSHLQVYSWSRLRAELGAEFIIEEACAQTATQCKVSGSGKVWERRPRSWRQVELSTEAPVECEWCLMAAMKSPLGAKQTYEERAMANIAQSRHRSCQPAHAYDNPWLMHSLVHYGYRLRNPVALETLADRVVATSRGRSNDYAAALCVKAYKVLDRAFEDQAHVRSVMAQIDAVTANPPEGPMGLRWKISLLFVKGRLLQELGLLEEAKRTYVACAGPDVRGFRIHLATKTTEAWFRAGKLAYALGDKTGAQELWGQGLAFGEVLLSASLDDILINRAFPNRFNHGDGVREYTLAWDNLAKCANGIHLLRAGRQIDSQSLENCFQSQYDLVRRDIVATRTLLVERTEALERYDQSIAHLTHELVEARYLLTDRTAALERNSRDLADRTHELVETRRVLVERTALLERSHQDLAEQTQELVAARSALIERTALLERAGGELAVRTQELVEARTHLAERTTLLEQRDRELADRTNELVETRALLAERTARLEQHAQELADRTRELTETRSTLVERTGLLEQHSQELADRTRELVEIRETLKERTALLESANQRAEIQAADLLDAPTKLSERAVLLEQRDKELAGRTNELAEAREILADRTARLDHCSRELIERTEELVQTRETLVVRTSALEKREKELANCMHELAETRGEFRGTNVRAGNEESGLGGAQGPVGGDHQRAG